MLTYLFFIVVSCVVFSSRLSASECLKHGWLLPSPTITESETSASPTPAPTPRPCSSGDGDLESELSSSVESDIHLRVSIGEEDEGKSCCSGSDLGLGTSSCSSSPLCQPDDHDTSDRLSSSSSSFILTPSSSPSPTSRMGSRLREKRGSLDLTKDHLRTFVSRWTDNPYLFDSPRGIITHLYGPHQETELLKKQRHPSRCTNVHGNHLTPHHRLVPGTGRGEPTGSSVNCGINIVSQIRRFSYQLHEELQIMKTHNHHCTSNLRKCSWGEVSVNVQ